MMQAVVSQGFYMVVVLKGRRGPTKANLHNRNLLFD